jgi:hypothetical protein
MRERSMGLLLLAGLLLAGTSHAQTWAAPVTISHDESLAFDTCALPSETLYIEYGTFSIYAPVAVYRIMTPFVGRPPAIHSWSLTMQPFGWDASLWVCRQRTGNQLNNCEDGSDNWGTNVPEPATVPAAWGTHWIVVTGNIENSYPYCGQFVLNAHRN